MAIINIEFKAKADNIKLLEEKLLTRNPVFNGEDHQTDSYFSVPSGRLKLREGNIENALIFYERSDETGIKQSNILLYKHQPDNTLKEILTKLHGIEIVVKKYRRIYFDGNVKIHFDRLEGLGTFIEVEAIGEEGVNLASDLRAQCADYAAFFQIMPADYIAVSYSDMLKEADRH